VIHIREIFIRAFLVYVVPLTKQPPFSPLRSGPKAALRPSRQKQIPSSQSVVLRVMALGSCRNGRTARVLELHGPVPLFGPHCKSDKLCNSPNFRRYKTEIFPANFGAEIALEVARNAVDKIAARLFIEKIISNLLKFVIGTKRQCVRTPCHAPSLDQDPTRADAPLTCPSIRPVINSDPQILVHLRAHPLGFLP
jgi:hypothetical protein